MGKLFRLLQRGHRRAGTDAFGRHPRPYAVVIYPLLSRPIPLVLGIGNLQGNAFRGTRPLPCRIGCVYLYRGAHRQTLARQSRAFDNIATVEEKAIEEVCSLKPLANGGPIFTFDNVLNVTVAIDRQPRQTR